jgi:anti-sigma B factor antagonist
MPFSVQMRDQRGRSVVGLSGELDVEPAANLRMLFDMLVEDGQVDVLVDLRLLTFCDSVGLSALIHGYHACHAAGGSFRVTGDTGLVERLLRVTGVRGLLIDQPEVCDVVDVSGRRPVGWRWTFDGSGDGQVARDGTDTAGDEPGQVG